MAKEGSDRQQKRGAIDSRGRRPRIPWLFVPSIHSGRSHPPCLHFSSRRQPIDFFISLLLFSTLRVRGRGCAGVRFLWWIPVCRVVAVWLCDLLWLIYWLVWFGSLWYSLGLWLSGLVALGCMTAWWVYIY